MIVVVLCILGQDLPKVLFTVDQQMVQALAPQRSRIPFHEGFRLRRGELEGRPVLISGSSDHTVRVWG